MKKMQVQVQMKPPFIYLLPLCCDLHSSHFTSIKCFTGKVVSFTSGCVQNLIDLFLKKK